jgi:transcriptional regulator with XRE-family HTH domain
MLCMAAEQSTGSSAVRIPQWTVGDRLRKAREEVGIGVEEIAAMLKRNRNSVTRYERSWTVDVNLVRSYAAITDTPMEWLLTGELPGDDDGDELSKRNTQRQQSGIFGDIPRPLKLVA